MYWTETDPVHPYDGVFRNLKTQYTTNEYLRILAASGFRDPLFENSGGNGISPRRRAWVTGPDGERHNMGDVLTAIFKAERLERLCRDRGDAVLGILRRAAK